MKPFLRAYHYDIGRGTYLTPATFAAALRLAAQSGYTHFVPYLEHMIRLPSIEKACPPCAYTAEDWREFETVAQAVGIKLVPHVNVIGHTETICPAYPELGGPVDRGHLDIDPGRAVTRAWTLRCLNEFCRISHSEYFLIGGDEWQPPQQLLAQPGFDAAVAWVEQVNRAVAFLKERGRKPIVWHDMLIHYPVALEKLSRDAVVAFWFYDYDSDYPVLDLFRQQGFTTLMASAVWGGEGATLGQRSLRALQAAAAAAEKHRAAGTMVTTWGDTRWEFQMFNIPMAARVLRGESPPAAILETISLFQTWSKLPTDTQRTQIMDGLAAPAWNEFPKFRDCLRAIVTGDVTANRASYIRFHHACGKGYERLTAGSTTPVWPEPTRVPAPGGFGLRVERDVLRFENGPESFVIYPKFGASLQNWRRDGAVIIPNSLEKALQRDPLPGGYRSYNAVGGLRAIWALGTHSNPCIIWQYPWRWRVVTETPEVVAVELAAEFPHVALTIRATVERGRSGFRYEARAVNRLAHAWGAFNFNLWLFFSRADLTAMKLQWAKGETTVAAETQPAFWIPAPGGITVQGSRWTLQVDAAAEQTAGYFVDWAPGLITPDLHGVYRPLRVGEELTTRWSFSVQDTHG